MRALVEFSSFSCIFHENLPPPLEIPDTPLYNIINNHYISNALLVLYRKQP